MKNLIFSTMVLCGLLSGCGNEIGSEIEETPQIEAPTVQQEAVKEIDINEIYQDLYITALCNDDDGIREIIQDYEKQTGESFESKMNGYKDFVMIEKLGKFSDDEQKKPFVMETYQDYVNIVQNVLDSLQKEQQLTNPNIAQEQVIISATRYLQLGGFSEKGLIEQLEYEQFSREDAEFAIEYLQPNWNEQCVQSATRYLKLGGFSRGSLTDQLRYEGFTTAQIEYALQEVGY